MFDFDAGKLVIIGIVALVVIGPKELPRVMRQVGQAVAKLRRLGAEFQAQFMEAMREADLDEIKLEAARISEAAKFDQGMDPLAGIRAELTKSLEEHSDGKPGADSEAEPGPEPLAAHTDPLVAALHENPEAARAAVESRDIGEPLAATASIPLSELPAPEPAPVPEPLHKRA